MAAVIRGLLASPLAERYDVEMIVTYRSAQPRTRLFSFLGSLIALARWSLRRGPRIAHVHSAVRGSLYRKAVCVLVVRLARRPVLLHFHAGMGDIEAFVGRLGPVRRGLFRTSLRLATLVLAVSAETARMMERSFGLEGIAVIPNAVPPMAPDELAASESPGESVLYLGGFANPVKGGEPFLAAVEDTAGEFPHTPFVLAGAGDPPGSLVELAARRPNVSWAGWLGPEAKRRQLARCAVFVLPSLSEGLPVALLEAMAWGRAIVATRVGGVPEVVADGAQALLVPAGDSDALSGAMELLLRRPEERERLAAAARERAAAFNESEVCDRLDSLYRELAR
jgi:glycosyltransferase involved in cell wall biosynthesis